jgi:hypothetical protein
MKLWNEWEWKILRYGPFSKWVKYLKYSKRSLLSKIWFYCKLTDQEAFLARHCPWGCLIRNHMSQEGGSRGISSINVTERRIGENLSLFITKQDHACNYVSLRWQVNVFYQNTPPGIVMEYGTIEVEFSEPARTWVGNCLGRGLIRHWIK